MSVLPPSSVKFKQEITQQLFLSWIYYLSVLSLNFFLLALWKSYERSNSNWLFHVMSHIFDEYICRSVVEHFLNLVITIENGIVEMFVYNSALLRVSWHYFTVFRFTRQEEPVCRTISLCTGMQSSTLAGLLATQFLGSSHAVPAACSVVAMAIMGLSLASFWGNGSRIRDTPLLFSSKPSSDDDTVKLV